MKWHFLVILSLFAISLKGMENSSLAEPTRDQMILALKEKWENKPITKAQIKADFSLSSASIAQHYPFKKSDNQQENFQITSDDNITKTIELIKATIQQEKMSSNQNANSLMNIITDNIGQWKFGLIKQFIQDPIVEQLSEWALQTKDETLLIDLAKAFYTASLRENMSTDLQEQLNWFALKQCKKVYQMNPTIEHHLLSERMIIMLSRTHPKFIEKEKKFTQKARDFLKKQTGSFIPEGIMLFQPIISNKKEQPNALKSEQSKNKSVTNANQNIETKINNLLKIEKFDQAAQACADILKNKELPSKMRNKVENFFNNLLKQKNLMAWYVKISLEEKFEEKVKAFIQAEKYYTTQAREQNPRPYVINFDVNTLANSFENPESRKNQNTNYAIAIYKYNNYCATKKLDLLRDAVYSASFARSQNTNQMWPFDFSLADLQYEVSLQSMDDNDKSYYMKAAAANGHAKAMQYIYDAIVNGIEELPKEKDIQQLSLCLLFESIQDLVDKLLTYTVNNHEPSKQLLKKLCSGGVQGISLSSAVRDRVATVLDKQKWKILGFDSSKQNSIDWLRKKAFYLYDQGNLDNAIICLEEAIKRGDVQSKIFLVDLLINKKEFNKNQNDKKIIQLLQSIIYSTDGSVSLLQKQYVHLNYFIPYLMQAEEDRTKVSPEIMYYVYSYFLNKPIIEATPEFIQLCGQGLETMEAQCALQPWAYQNLIFQNNVIDSLCNHEGNGLKHISPLSVISYWLLERLKHASAHNLLSSFPIDQIIKPLECIEEVMALLLKEKSNNHQNLSHWSFYEVRLYDQLKSLTSQSNFKVIKKEFVQLEFLERLLLLILLQHPEATAVEYAGAEHYLELLSKTDKKAFEYLNDYRAFLKRFKQNEGDDIQRSLLQKFLLTHSAILQKNNHLAMGLWTNLITGTRKVNASRYYVKFTESDNFNQVLEQWGKEIDENLKNYPNAEHYKSQFIRYYILKAAHELLIADEYAKNNIDKYAQEHGVEYYECIKKALAIDEFSTLIALAHEQMQGNIFKKNIETAHIFLMQAAKFGLTQNNISQNKIDDFTRHVKLLLTEYLLEDNIEHAKMRLQLLEACQKLPGFDISKLANE